MNRFIVEALRECYWGGLLGASLLVPFVFFLRGALQVGEILPGAMAGATLGFLLKACLPRGHPVPKDLTTLTFLSVSAFCRWVVADGVVKGEIHGMPHRRYFIAGFRELWLWEHNPKIFLLYVLTWGVFGLACVGIPIWYYLKAMRELGQSDANDIKSTLSSLPGAMALLRIYDTFKTLPENTQAIALFAVIVSSILIFLYLVLILL